MIECLTSDGLGEPSEGSNANPTPGVVSFEEKVFGAIDIDLVILH